MSIKKTAVLLILLVTGTVSTECGCGPIGRELVGELASDAGDSDESQDGPFLGVCEPNAK